LHRIRTIRQQQGITLRCAARRLNLSIDQVKAQEAEMADMLLTMLYRWQEVLGVPVADLLVDEGNPLSEPVLKRAQLVRVMKTAAAIFAHVESEPVQRLAQMLVDQLIEIMPELKEVSPWHAVGQRRTREDVGRVAENPFPASLFPDAALL
jgi:transcriptional regulator with XRE-family HTH domain